MLVYDITKRDTFESVKDVYAVKIKEKCRQNIQVVLLGNKSDLKDKRKVSEDDGADLAYENGYTFMESSCVDNYNVSDAFTALVEMTNNHFKKMDEIGLSPLRKETFTIKSEQKSKKKNKKKNKEKKSCC